MRHALFDLVNDRERAPLVSKPWERLDDLDVEQIARGQQEQRQDQACGERGGKADRAADGFGQQAGLLQNNGFVCVFATRSQVLDLRRGILNGSQRLDDPAKFRPHFKRDAVNVIKPARHRSAEEQQCNSCAHGEPADQDNRGYR